MNKETETSSAEPKPRGASIAASRVVVIAVFSWIALFGAGAFWVSLQIPEGAELRESPFREWDGVWEGEFEGFNAEGERVTHIRVRQRYRHIPNEDEFRQEGHFTVTDIATGETEEEKALNSAAFDGTNLRCKVFKKKGSVVEEHMGEKEDGEITWTRDIPGAKETFREWIEGDTYFIEGEGLYGDRETATPIRFEAAYHRVE
jgi:hypothetical protein